MSAALAGALALSLSVPAFAAGNTDTRSEIGMDGLADGAEVEITGTTRTADVKIKVPTSGAVTLNPYGLSVTVAGNSVTDQVISAPQYIENESDLPVKVTAKVTGTIEGAEFSETAVASGETAKKVHLEFNIGATTATDAEPRTYSEAKAVKNTAVECAPITMDEKTGTNKAVAYKFTGDATANPDTPWTRDDIVGATIAFTFKLEGGSGGGGGASTYTISEGSHTDTGSVITKVEFKDSSSNVITSAAAGDTVTVEVTATTGKTISGDVNGTGFNLTDSSSSGTYTGTFTMPSANATVTLTVA